MGVFFFVDSGPLAGHVIRCEEGEEWTIGRDPELCFATIEDPMVSRKHLVLRSTEEGYFLENLSEVNPASVNGVTIADPVPLKEGDIVQIGSVFLRFTLQEPHGISAEDMENTGDPLTIYEEREDLGSLAFSENLEARWIVKVVSGPNAGAEFGLYPGLSYVVGKDPNVSDFVFRDVTVSAKHARISAQIDGKVTIEDLGSKNRVFVNGSQITEPTLLHAQDLVALGTTSLFVIDRENARETLVMPSPKEASSANVPAEQKSSSADSRDSRERKNWKQMLIPTRHLVIAGGFSLVLLMTFVGMLSLFKSEKIALSTQDALDQIDRAIRDFPEVEYSFNASGGTLFVLGHVMTEVDHQQVTYLLQSLPFVRSIEDNIVVDEKVWENMNALIMKYPPWRGVHLTSKAPGHFVLKGCVERLDEATQLAEYINLNFSYLDKLENQIVVENILAAQIQSALAENRFANVTFRFAHGELILEGHLAADLSGKLQNLIDGFKEIRGVRLVKNFIILTEPVSDIVDLSANYAITGSSKHGKVNQYVVIDGKILAVGDHLDGMRIAKIEEGVVFLEKNGIKYRIHYD